LVEMVHPGSIAISISTGAGAEPMK